MLICVEDLAKRADVHSGHWREREIGRLAIQRIIIYFYLYNARFRAQYSALTTFLLHLHHLADGTRTAAKDGHFGETTRH